MYINVDLTKGFIASLQEVVYCLNDGEYGSFVNWDSPTEIFKEMLPIVLKVYTCTHIHAAWVCCMLHVLPHYCLVHAPPVSRHMNAAESQTT